MFYIINAEIKKRQTLKLGHKQSGKKLPWPKTSEKGMNKHLLSNYHMENGWWAFSGLIFMVL